MHQSIGNLGVDALHPGLVAHVQSDKTASERAYRAVKYVETAMLLLLLAKAVAELVETHAYSLYAWKLQNCIGFSCPQMCRAWDLGHDLW